MTTWKSLHYYRLRANFDGYSSAYVPNPPKELETDGKAVFDIRKRVIDISCIDGTVTLKFEDLINGEEGAYRQILSLLQMDADLTSASYSFLASLRHYAGYLTWRATIPENSISEETQQAFNDKSASYKSHKSYIIGYV